MSVMNVDHVLATLGSNGLEFLLIGGMNFLLRHEPVLTFDIDVWIHDSASNLDRCEAAMSELDASWGASDEVWRPVSEQPGWTRRQVVFCLVTPHGSVNISDPWKALGRGRIALPDPIREKPMPEPNTGVYPTSI